MKKKALLAVAVSAAMAASLPVSALAAEGSLPRNETLYFSGQQWGTVNDYNPMSPNSNNAMVIAANDAARTLVYETLYMWNPLNSQLYPLLAAPDSQPEWDENQANLTVTLNPDAKWSDGTQVTAADVVATVKAHMDYETSAGADMKNYIESAEAIDDTTVVFHAVLNEEGKAVNPLMLMSYMPKLYIMQEAYLNTVAERNNGSAEDIKLDRMEDLVASGPYKPYIANDQQVVLERDDNYWGQAESMWGSLPAPKYIAHTIFKDNAAGDTAFKQGEVDVSQQFTTDIQKYWEEQGLPISTYLLEPPYGICMTMPTMVFNTEIPGLDQVAVRKAIAMATDYDQIIASAMSGQSPSFADVPRSIMNPTDGEQAMVDNDALADLQWANKDVEGAIAVLDEAGIVDSDGDGIREYNGENLSFKAECPQGWTDWNAALEIVAQAGKDIGINIETYFPDASTYTDDYSTGKFDIVCASGPGSSIANPWQRAMWFMSSTYNTLSVNFSGNFGHFTNERADELLALIPYESDEATLKEYYTELSKIMLEEVPCAALMYRPQVFHAVNESVWTGYPMDGDGTDIPPMDCTDGYGIAALYNLVNVE